MNFIWKAIDAIAKLTVFLIVGLLITGLLYELKDFHEYYIFMETNSFGRLPNYDVDWTITFYVYVGAFASASLLRFIKLMTK
jgi:hypothetical protein